MPNLLVTQSDLKFDNQQIYFHGDLDSWYLNPKIDTTIKVAMLITYYYTKESNKDINPIERFRAQNTYLVEKFGLSKKIVNGTMVGVRTIQKSLRKLVDIGFIKNRYYIGAGNELVSFADNPQGGITGRRIEPDTAQMRTLLRTVPGDATYQSFVPRSIERRMSLRRPMSLIDMINNTVVRDLKAAKQAFNRYVKMQIKRYTSQNVTLDEALDIETTLDSKTESILISAALDVIRLLHIEVDSII